MSYNLRGSTPSSLPSGSTFPNSALRNSNDRLAQPAPANAPAPSSLSALWSSRDGIDKGLVRRSSALRVEAVVPPPPRRVSFRVPQHAESEILDATEAGSSSALNVYEPDPAAKDYERKLYRKFLNLNTLENGERIRGLRKKLVWALGACIVLFALVLVFARRRKHEESHETPHLHFQRRDGVANSSDSSLVSPTLRLQHPTFLDLQKRAELFLGNSPDTQITITKSQIEAELASSAYKSRQAPQLPAAPPSTVSIASSTFDDPNFTGGYTSDPSTWHSEPQIDLPRTEGTIVVVADNMSPDSWDNTDAFQAGVDSCRRVIWTGAPCVLKLPFENALFRFRDRTVQLAGLQDFTIDGNGATLLFARTSSTSPLIQIDTCLRCKFFNFKVDWDWTVSRLATVVRIASATPNLWTLSFPSNQPIPDPSNIHGWVSMHSLDQSRWSMGALGQIDGWFGLGDRISGVWREGETVKIQFASQVWPVPTADL